MKSRFIVLFSNVLLGAAILAGCSKSESGALAGLDPAKVPDTVNHAFEKAPEAARQEATNYVAAFQNQDAPAAFTQLLKMKQQKDLTTDQRMVVAKAIKTSFKQLQVAAQNGDSKAQAVLNQYLSTR